MSDLRTELATKVLPALKAQSLETLKFDDEAGPEEPPKAPPKPKNGVTADTFDLIKQSPHKYRASDVARVLKSLHNRSSVTSLATQMLRSGCIAKDAYGRLYAVADHYTLARPDRPSRAVKAERTQVPAHTPAPTPTINVEELTVGEARALYSQLKAVFGGS